MGDPDVDPVVQPTKVLLGDLSVGADVDDVDALIAECVEVLDRPGDDPLRNQGLAEPHFVGQQISLNRILEHPAHDFDLMRLELDPGGSFSGRRGRISLDAPPH